jgi:hypothetical protein
MFLGGVPASGFPPVAIQKLLPIRNRRNKRQFMLPLRLE